MESSIHSRYQLPTSLRHQAHQQSLFPCGIQQAHVIRCYVSPILLDFF